VGPWFELAVIDNGAGIRADVREKIFTPLFSTKAFGVGLGMPLVKRIVERHHGTIDVASTWGQGTTVTIRLPLAGRDGQVRQEAGRKG
jgi:signal transduction histidine kinase